MENKGKLKIPFTVKLCSDKAAFEVRIQRKFSFNMANLERILRSLKESEIIVSTPHILIFRNKKAEVTISRDGRMLIKKVKAEKDANAVAHEVLLVASCASLTFSTSTKEHRNAI